MKLSSISKPILCSLLWLTVPTLFADDAVRNGSENPNDLTSEAVKPQADPAAPDAAQSEESQVDSSKGAKTDEKSPDNQKGTRKGTRQPHAFFGVFVNSVHPAMADRFDVQHIGEQGLFVVHVDPKTHCVLIELPHEAETGINRLWVRPDQLDEPVEAFA